MEIKESLIEAKLCKYANKLGMYQFKGEKHGGGLPDRVVIYKGYVLFLEIKQQKHKTNRLRHLTPAQNIVMKKLWEQGCLVALVCGYKEGFDTLTEFKNTIDKLEQCNEICKIKNKYEPKKTSGHIKPKL